MVTEKKREYRDEKFTVRRLYSHAIVRVHNMHINGAVTLQIESGKHTEVLVMTPDEVDQLAEMLRSSVRGLRGEQTQPDPLRAALETIQSLCNMELGDWVGVEGVHLPSNLLHYAQLHDIATEALNGDKS